VWLVKEIRPRIEGVAHVVEHLPSKCEVLSSKPWSCQKENRKRNGVLVTKIMSGEVCPPGAALARAWTSSNEMSLWEPGGSRDGFKVKRLYLG
jgi:hypothetical protein